MSKVGLTAYTRQFSGRFGDIVFRDVNGQSVAALPPRNAGQSNSPAQRDVRQRFRKAVSYAQAAMADPAQRPAYDEAAVVKRKPAFALAVGDYFKPPLVQEIIVAGYRGKVGDPIKVVASDDIGVVGLTVAIKTAAGVVIEQGPATLTYGQWVYHGTTVLAHAQNVIIAASATDRPGNAATLELPYVAP